MAASFRLLLIEPSESDERLIRAALRGHATRFSVSAASTLREARARLHAAVGARRLAPLAGAEQALGVEPRRQALDEHLV